MIDYEYIKDDMRDAARQFQVLEVPYDPFQATQLSGEMVGEGFPMVEVGATVKNFSEPMKELEKLAHVDKKDNVFPNKERPENKIDGIVAEIMALSRAMLGGGAEIGMEAW